MHWPEVRVQGVHHGLESEDELGDESMLGGGLYQLAGDVREDAGGDGDSEGPEDLEAAAGVVAGGAAQGQLDGELGPALCDDVMAVMR